MKRIVHSMTAGVLGVFFVAGLAAAQKAGETGSLGLGAMIGSPTGITGKYWVSESQAIDGAMGLSVGHRNDFQIQSDYLWHFPSRYLGVADMRVPFYVGSGLRITGGDGATAGIRFPGGIDFLMNTAPVEFFAEIAPVFRFAPNVTGDLDGAVGVRYYFK